ncbi:MAG: HPF/RaiA family ribosome-associated protein [Pseudomonadota bacterium]
MKRAVEIQFLGMDPSDDLEAEARATAERLVQACRGILSCTVAIEMLQRSTHRPAGPYAVRVDATVPGHAVTVSRMNNEDARAALRSAFNSMGLRLQALDGGASVLSPFARPGQVPAAAHIDL